MRVAALYDVHGNVRALAAVLAELESLAVDAVVVGGDVAPGPWPRETVEELRRLGDRAIWIRGNGERELVHGPADAFVSRTPPLPPELSAFLGDLPLTAELEVDGLGRVLFCHATPRDDVEIFTELTPAERLEPVFAGVSADVVVCGHTHTQFERQVGDVRIVNAGSVGLAYEDEPGAYWTLLGPDVEFRRTRYDVARAEAAIAASGFGEWPTASRAEAVAFFESQALGG